MGGFALKKNNCTARFYSRLIVDYTVYTVCIAVWYFGV